MRLLLTLPLIAFLAARPALALPAERTAAERALAEGRVDDVVKLVGSSQDAASQLVLCRAYYAEQLGDEAVAACETALKSLGDNSQAQVWMGRAYGLKARTASPFAAMRWARKVKAAFERAFAIDASNPSAANDLGEFYVGAPAIVGGGLDLATDLASRLNATMPEAGHRIKAMVAEKQHDYATAEREFRAATAVANRAEAWVDLGAYYFRRNDGKQASAALERAVSLDPHHGPPTVDVATLFEENHWSSERSMRLLREYLEGSSRSDDAPAFAAYTRLGLLLRQSGDREGAKIEINKALALASKYAPARKALQGL